MTERPIDRRPKNARPKERNESQGELVAPTQKEPTRGAFSGTSLLPSTLPIRLFILEFESLPPPFFCLRIAPQPLFD